jgi:type IV secretion system protein TrbL
MDPTVLQRLITGIEAALAPGLAALRPFLVFWVTTLVFLEGVRVYGAILEDGRRWQHVGSFVVRTLVFTAVLWGWPAIMSTLVDDFVHAGLRFGGNQMTVQEFLDPGRLLVQGIKTAKPLADLVKANAGITGAVYFFPFLGAWLLFLLSYAIMSCAVFLAQVEFRIVMPVSLLALGFVFWAPTRSLASGVISYALNVSLRFFMQAILASLIFRLAPIMTPTITASNAFDVSMLQAFGMIVTAGLMVYLFLKIPFVIANHLAGTPSLSTGGLLQTIAGLTGVATGATMLLRSHGPAWNIRQPRAPQRPSPGLPTSAPRSGPPPMPAAQALNATLRAGAHFLSHNQSGGGLHLSP